MHLTCASLMAFGPNYTTYLRYSVHDGFNDIWTSTNSIWTKWAG
jgi:hypothetical protein